MSEFFDVAVVGGGLAGSCAAILLAQSGIRVVLLEGAVVGRHKVCGEFLSPESRVQLRQLEVLIALQHVGARNVTRARVCTSAQQGRSIPLSGEGLAVSRATLDTVLWKRALEAGVDARDQSRVTRIEPSEGGFTLSTPQEEVHARFVLSATGRGAKWGRDSDEHFVPHQRFVGLKTHFQGARTERGEVALFPFAGGYCGLVEVENGRTNACLLAPYSRLKNSSPSALWAEIRSENQALNSAVGDGRPLFEWKATGNVSFSQFAPVHEGILRVGDAAGYIHPLSGDGMAMALRSGELAARTLEQAVRRRWPRNKTERVYSTMWKNEFSTRLRWAGVLQPLFCDARFSNVALRVFDLFPALSSLAVKGTRGRSTP